MGKYLLILCVIFLGCLKPKDNQPLPELPAPDGNTFQSDMNGVLHPTFVAEGVATQMNDVSVESGANEFRGVAFDMAAGARPQITVVGKSGVQYRALIYGPQTIEGLWGRALHEVGGVDSVVIDTWEAPQSGHYLILALPRPEVTFEYTVSIECEGCELDRCQAEAPCNSYCPQGRVIDAGSGCTTCECAGASCVVEGCLEDNEICVFSCGEDSCEAGQTCMRGRCLDTSCEAECEDDEACFEGECQLARYECAAVEAICEESCPPLRDPVCASVGGRSRTVPNRCLAECLEADSIETGPCESSGCQGPFDCTDGEICDSGMCIPEPGCTCDETPDMPVCGEEMGVRKTFRNACEMNCANHELEYEGACIVEQLCDTSLDCRVSERCIALPDGRIAGNESRCEAADSEGCVRACINRKRCREDSECGSGNVCVLGSDVGLCMPVCGGADDCEMGEHCSTRLRDPIGMSIGVCLTKCSTDNSCHETETCSPLDSVCLPCDSCSLSPELPLCFDGRQFANGCELLCGDLLIGATLPMPPVSVEAEVCNGVDDDCDGQTDESLVQACEGRSSQCRVGQQRCVDGEWGQCEPVANQQAEVCNGLDDDCDGEIDEGVAVRTCQRESGQCRSGRQSCVDGGWSQCEPIANGETELCNGLDDDCDGEIDERPLVLPAGETECNLEADCSSCPLDWAPVCTSFGVVPNTCFAECYRLDLREFSYCGLREAPRSRCSTDDDCMRSRECADGEPVCGDEDLQLACNHYHSSGACFASHANCLCDRNSGLCGFVPTPETIRCLESVEGTSGDGQPSR
jgi:hypothetical protein